LLVILSTNAFNSGSTLFFSLLVATIPSLFCGIVVSSLLLLWFDSRRKRRKQTLNAWECAFLGILCSLVSPVGQYGHFPIARRLLLGKVPTAAAIAFFLAAPTCYLGNLWMTYRVFAIRSDMVWWRVGGTLIIALIVALIFSTATGKPDDRGENEGSSETRLYSSLVQSGTILSVSKSDFVSQVTGKAGEEDLEFSFTDRKQENALARKRLARRVDLFLDNLFKEFWEFGGVTIVGCAVTTLTLLSLKQVDFLLVTNGSILSIGRSMLYGFVLSLGASANTAFMATLGGFFTKGAIVASLVFCAFVDLKSIGLLLLTFRAKVAVYLLLLLVLLSFLFGSIVDIF
jgi:uncharacterized protein